MMKKNEFLLIILLIPFVAFAQKYSVDGTIKGLNNSKITISSFYGNEDRVIDSVFTDSGGAFSYAAPNFSETGMYRFRFAGNQYLDLILGVEKIQFTTNLDALIDDLVFESSNQNQLYYQYLKKRNLTDFKLELLTPLLTYYPKDDPFFDEVQKTFDLNAALMQSFVDDLAKNQPNQFVTRFIQSDFTPVPADITDFAARIEYMRNHFFDHVDFSDTTLLYSPVFSGKLIQYLSFYQNNRLPKEQLEVEFIKAVNHIMTVTAVNPVVYEYAMNYLIGGFESYGFNKVITYIADNINLDDNCVNTERKAELEKKVESLRKFAVGQKAPHFEVLDLQGNPINLSDMPSEYTLLVFWATWCPHCTSLIPEIQKLYSPQNKSKLEVISVSLDDSPEALSAYMDDHPADWITVADFKKWKGELVQQFDIYATPTMFLLYRDRTILAKPLSIDDLKTVLIERNILK
jgi:peroxiredoxin